MGVAILLAFGASMPSSAQVCAPLDNGRVANVHYEGTALVFEPIVEFREMVLTITGPCEDIVRVFGPKDTVAFDIREIERVTDGQYSWELRRVANIDPGVQEDLQTARGTGEEDALWWSYFQKGAIPEGPYVDSGAFSVVKGLIVDPTGVEERRASVGSKTGAALAGASLAGESSQDLSSRGAGDNPLSTKDFVINDDLIVIGSACVGFDCVNGEVFGFDTIRLKENNLRIQFNDTSGSSFPTTNWQIRANSSQSGGESFLGFMDQGANGEAETGTRVFAVEANAGSNALFVESGGDVGFGTGSPILNLHVVDGDSPGLRLEQDASSGFQAQTWDIAGNETNFFVRDATGGSTLPFRIFPGNASSRLVIRNGNVGLGTTSPDVPLHVFRNTGSDATLFKLQNNGGVRFEFENTVASNGGNWQFINTTNSGGADLVIRETVANGTEEFRLTETGNLTISGSLTVGPGGCTGCDLVFSPDYHVESIEEHSAYMWENRHLPGVGPTPEDQPMNLSKKTGGILNELEKAHIYIEQLNDSLRESQGEVASVTEENEQLREEQQRIVEDLRRLTERLESMEAAAGTGPSSQ